MQIDDLDLAWDDGDGQRPRRHRRSTRRAEQRQVQREQRGRGRGRSILALVLSMVIVGALGGGAWYGVGKVRDFFTVPDYTSAGSGEVNVEVHKGDSTSDIAATLAAKDVVKSPKAFINAAEKDPRSLGIAPGIYQMRLKMRGVDALRLILDPKSRVTNTVTVVEGAIARDIFAMLSQKTGIPVAEFEAAAKDPVALGVPEFWFTRDDGKPVNKSIEGFLFPATYELHPNATAKEILTTMVSQFLTITQKLDFVNRVQTERHISPYEVLITASIAQVEAPLAADMSKVARVIYNRLYGDNFPTRRLELDSVVNYWLKSQGKDPKVSQDLLQQELHNPNNPYNTHDVPGFPPGPISSPGEVALTAAMSPDPDTGILFFVTIDKEGHTAFSRTFAEHERNIAIARENGAL